LCLCANAEDDEEDEDVENENFFEGTEVDEEPETPKQKPSSVSDIEEEMATMKIGKPSASLDPFSMSFRFPYIQYTYIADGRRYVSIDFLVPGMSKDMFRPKVEGADLVLGVVMPDFFVNENCLKMAHQDDRGFKMTIRTKLLHSRRLLERSCPIRQAEMN
jgi:hypothetical protein